MADPKYFKKSSKALTFRATMEVVIRKFYPAEAFPTMNYRIKRVSGSCHTSEETYIRHALGKRFCCKPKGSPFLSFMSSLATPPSEKLRGWQNVTDGPLLCFRIDPKDSEETKRAKEAEQQVNNSFFPLLSLSFLSFLFSSFRFLSFFPFLFLFLLLWLLTHIQQLLPQILETFAVYAKRAKEVIIWEAMLMVL